MSPLFFPKLAEARLEVSQDALAHLPQGTSPLHSKAATSRPQSKVALAPDEDLIFPETSIHAG